ncbi:MAG TPA: AraC family transcriptional regulator [Planktothrix sp.]|jgi:AraC-like DNA-binding protein
MDTLSDVLSSVRFQSAIYGLIECSAPWGIQLPSAEGHLRLFMVVRGGCLIQFEGEKQPISLAAGELVFCRKDAAAEFKDASDSSVVPIEQIVCQQPARGRVLKTGGGGASSSLILGCFILDAHQHNPFMTSLPGIIHLASQHVQAEPGLESTIRLLISEVSGNGPGGDILVSRLSDAIFVQIVRAYIAQIKHCKETPGWLKALTDPDIGPALNLIHEKPEAPWTVASLADAVNMSRTSFATKFAALVMQTPIDYLTSWRMQKAVTLIRDEKANVEDIASAVGYTSRAAFAKAFKKELGRSPGEYRKSVAV